MIVLRVEEELLENEQKYIQTYLETEVTYWLSKVENGNALISIEKDITIEDYAFAIDYQNNSWTIKVSKMKDAVSAVYELLRRWGFLFTINGCRNIPSKINLDIETGLITPLINKRGVRQHINFPMDISSYSVEEAMEYIKNLARTGFNFITFHSYPEQWYEYKMEGKQYYAGHYFYSKPHPVHKDSFIKPFIGNHNYYMIPKHEPYFGIEEELSKKSIEWLNLVMEQAKLCGMKIQLSIEPRGCGVGEGIEICKSVLKQYPIIDTLELITQECGTNGPVIWKKKDIINNIENIYGDSIEGLKSELKKYVKEDLIQLPVTMKELKANIDIIHSLEGNIDVELACGVYATDTDTLNMSLAIMRKALRDNIIMTFLSAHGASVVAANLSDMKFTIQDLERSIIYSWAEFDGSMYLQQSATNGVESCVNALQEKLSGQKINGLVINHWRNEENLVTLSYLGAKAVNDMSQDNFYQEFCEKQNMKDWSQCKKAFDTLEEASEYVRFHLFNIGFCYLNCWIDEGLGYIGKWNKEEVNHGLVLYYQALKEFDRINTQNDTITFLQNRIRCTIYHLQAIETLVGLQQLCAGKSVAEITDQDRNKIKEICQKARFFIEEYQKLHCEALRDRGCEGTIVSYEYTIPTVVKRLEEKYIYNKETVQTDTADAPPSPAIYE